MEARIVFDDFTEVQASDFDDLGTFAQQSMDHIVQDGVTNSLRYSGFNTVKSNAAEITVAPGRFYGKNAAGEVGAVFPLKTQTIISLVQYLAVSTQRYLTLVVSGVEDLGDNQTRDKLINVTTEQVEPQIVSMTITRDAVLTIIAGAEGANPIAPSAAVTQVAIANILMNPTGVVSVTMLPGGLVTSTEQLDGRLDVVEAFDLSISDRITGLTSALAALQNAINGLGQHNDVVEIYKDLAEVKAKVGLPASYSHYGAWFFLWPDPTQYDLNNSNSLGFAATIDMGIRFPAQNAAIFALTLFNPLDPNAAYHNGLLLPAYNSVLKLQTSDQLAQSIAMGQYGFTTYALVEQDIAFSRIRAGASYVWCTNGNNSYTPGDTTAAWWLPNFSTYQTVTTQTWYDPSNPSHIAIYTNYYWHDTWTEPYWRLDTINHSINGAQLWQSWLASSDMWVTDLSIYISAIASTTDVNYTLCRVTNGQPDLSKVISHTVLAGVNLVVGWNKLTIQPAYVQKGDRMAVLITSSANHQIGMCAGGSYLDGTFGYTQDGAYFLGDFTKEMMLRVYGAQFLTSQAAIELGALNLSGGIRDIDLTARMIVPASCQLVFEVLPDGAGVWLPITPDTPLVPFAGAPVLCRFRARFVGTPDVAPGIQLNDSICKIWCPAAVLKFVSEAQTVPSTTGVTVQLKVENWNTIAHTATIRVWFAGAYHTPTSTTTTLVDASAGRYLITSVFSAMPATTSLIFVVDGTTTSVADTFHGAELLYWM